MKGRYCINTIDGYYTIETGTSFAAPQAAGAVVLLEKKRGRTLSPAMLKASLIGTAVSLANGTDARHGVPNGPRPSLPQGYGRLNLAETLSGAAIQSFWDEAMWSAFTGAGQGRYQTFTIRNTSSPTIIVLAWTDEAGVVNTSNPNLPTLVRDLDMWIQTDSCHYYTGNRMTSGEVSELQTSSACGGSGPTFDRANNVEMIVIPPNTRTGFTLQIACSTWAGGAHNQKFAVFLTNVY